MPDYNKNSEEKAKFDLIKKADEIKDDKGNVLISSLQKITQPSTGASSEHLVIAKIKRNNDGTQNGTAKNIFIPRSLVAQLLTQIKSLSA